MQQAARIGSQILCSTRPNAFGERLTEQDLRSLLATMPQLFPIYEEHDISLPPIGFASSPHLVQLADGELAIEAEIYFYDPQKAKELPGLSLTYRTRTQDNQESPDVEIQFDSRYLPADDLEDAAKALDHIHHRISDVRRNAVSEVGLIIIFLGNALLNGFLEAPGKLIYDAVVGFLKKVQQRRKIRTGGFGGPAITTVIIKGKDEVQGRPCEFFLKFTNLEEVPIFDLDNIFRNGKAFLLTLIQSQKEPPVRISAEYQTSKGRWHLIYGQNADGQLLLPESDDRNPPGRKD